MNKRVPGTFETAFVLFRMQLTQFRRGRKFRLGLFATGFVVLAVTLAHHLGVSTTGLDVRTAAEQAEESVGYAVEFGYFRLLVYFLPFLFASGAIGEEVEGGTFSYLLTRPLNRVAIALGKWAAATLVTVLLLISSLLVVHLVCYATEPTALFEALPSTLRIAVSLALLATAYCALCLALGSVVPHSSGVLPAVYLAFMEFCCSFLPSVLRLLSLNFSARRLAGFEVGGLLPETVPDISPLVGGVIVSAGLVIFVVSAVLIVRFSEFESSR